MGEGLDVGGLCVRVPNVHICLCTHMHTVYLVAGGGPVGLHSK